MLKIMLFLSILLSACWKVPPQAECAPIKSCAPCVEKGCGWCRNGCYSSSSDNICPQPIDFPTHCKDGSSPFPSQVINPPHYGPR